MYGSDKKFFLPLVVDFVVVVGAAVVFVVVVVFVNVFLDVATVVVVIVVIFVVVIVVFVIVVVLVFGHFVFIIVCADGEGVLRKYSLYKYILLMLLSFTINSRLVS